MTATRRRTLALAGLITILSATGAVEAPALDTGTVAGRSVQARQFSNAVFTAYPGGYFWISLEPYGSLYDNTLFRYQFNGVVNESWWCDHINTYNYVSASGQDNLVLPMIAEPTGTATTASITGFLPTCFGSEPYTLTVTMTSTSIPQYGGIPPRAPGYNYAYVEREGVASGTFCWNSPSKCTAFGVGQSASGYTLITEL